MKILNLQRDAHSPWRVAALLAVSLITSSQAAAADPDSAAARIGDILRQVEAATRPPKAYAAAVHQTVTRPAAGASTSSSATRAELLAEEDYAVIGADSGATRATKKLSSKRTAQNTPAAAGKAAPHIIYTGLITVNPLKALRHVATMPAPEILDAFHQDLPCYQISAKDDHFELVLWVAKAGPAVRRLLIRGASGVILDTTLDYKHWNGLLVPAHVEIISPSNGTTTIQDYSAHAF